ncbi:MAG: 2-phospho-L-lactate guanylyltransferase [Proteobacteria bacterium]|nr:2-phospho-L-lactate guanylyltransferase [Pseudomonadota bacterium]
MTGPLCALVPAKSFTQAKSRLAAAMSPAERQALAQHLLARTLEACLGCATIERIYLLTTEPTGPEWAARYGVRLLRDTGAANFATVIDHALDELAADGGGAVCYVASDLPEVTAESLGELVAEDGRVAVFAAAARDGGPNAFCMALPRRIQLAFGVDSAAGNAAKVLATGAGARTATIGPLALDLDVPADLEGLPARALLGTLSS